MFYERLKKNIVEVVKEEQVKLGFSKEIIRLYYPLESLNRIMGTSFDKKEMLQSLYDFSRSMKYFFWEIEISEENGRFCLILPPKTSVYVHENTPESGFLYDFIGVIGRHGILIDEVLSVFRKYSERVHFEKVSNGEFDYLIYFENGVPDTYRYCLTDEGHHIIYHRYSPEEYQAIVTSFPLKANP